MRKLFDTTATYIAAEDGAVTVDWVVLTAAMVGLGMAAMMVVSGGVEDLSGDVSVELASIEVGFEISAPFETQQWTARNPGIHDSYSSWMSGFADQQLLDHYNNMAQYAATTETGHPYDTYHDEFWIARDEAITRGLVEQDAAIPPTT